MATNSCTGTVRRVKRRNHHQSAAHHQPLRMAPNLAEVEGYGPYKPVPPPKPCPASSYSPPPYRMPPYPLYGDAASIPGCAPVPEFSAPPPGGNTAALHTHSSKFPIEREVILSSTDKNSKIPILHEYKKRPKSVTAIAPDGPNKQLAWTEDKKAHEVLNGDEDPLVLTRVQHGQPLEGNMGVEEMGHHVYKAQPLQMNDASGRCAKPSEYRQYRPGPESSPYLYNGQHSGGATGGVSTGAVPRNWSQHYQTSQQATAPPTQQPQQQQQQQQQTSRRVVPNQNPPAEPKRDPPNEKPLENNKLATEEPDNDASSKDLTKDATDKNKAVRTYHTIKDMISSRFGKLPKDMNSAESEGGGVTKQTDVPALNNTPTTVEGPSKNINGTPRKANPPRKEESSQVVSNQNEYERQRMLGGGPQQQVLGPSRHYNSSFQGLPPPRPEAERRGPDQNVYATARVEHQGQNGRTEFVQQQEPTYYHGAPRTKGGVRGQSAGMDQGGIYMVMRQNGQRQDEEQGTRDIKKIAQNFGGMQSRRGSQSRLDEDDDDDEGGFVKSSGQSSDYEKATQRSTGQSDSGRGSTVYSSGGHHQLAPPATGKRVGADAGGHSTESSESPQTGVGGRREAIYGLASANDSEWVDIVESELRQILDPKMHGLSLQGAPPGANSTLSESISSLTPPLPPLSPGGGSSPATSPRNSRYKHSSSKSYHHERSSGGGGGGSRGWNGRGSSKMSEKQHRQHSKKDKSKHGLSSSVFGLDDLTSTTTGLDSMLDGNTENNSSDDTTIDTSDTHAIRKQLEGLENMYSEVLKLLGVKKYGGRYQPSDPRVNKRRLYGSMSSLPSSVSSRPIRDKRRQDERKKVKDMKGINKRFQRLESHVVTLARSVAHLSSEMRTQHLMIQEMENIRSEISALRTQTMASRSQSVPRGLNNMQDRDANLSNPTRVKKLTKFFGDEPPLLRLFLKRLGYEKYADKFEQERVGMVELPYLSEERLQKMGVPLGPRLRILQEAQVSICRDKVYIV